MDEVTARTLHEARERMDRGELSARDLVAATLERIEAVESRVQAFLTLLPERALAEAEAMDARRAKGEMLPPLAGIPIALKDNLCTEGIRTTCASKILHNVFSPYDATVVSRLRAAGDQA